MNNGVHRENGRPKPPQGQWPMKKQPSMREIMVIMAERDRAIQERDCILQEKRSALAERDMAIRQRDSFIQERNAATMERENALSTLQYREEAIKNGVKLPPHHIKGLAYKSREIHHVSEPLSPQSPPTESAKPKSVKRALKEPKKPIVKKIRRERDEIEGRPKHSWKDPNQGLNLVEYDDSIMPVPVCSCTGVFRSCYKWGSGGWQSSCCTTSLSMYPLPQVPNKRHARIGGRKMSGGAFNKLLTRLAAEGRDLSQPVDLKDNWARHGTNRYITIK